MIEYTIVFKNDKEAYEFSKGLYCLKYTRSKYLKENFKELFEKVMVQINTQYDFNQEAKKLKESESKIKPTKYNFEQEQWIIR